MSAVPSAKPVLLVIGSPAQHGPSASLSGQLPLTLPTSLKSYPDFYNRNRHHGHQVSGPRGLNN